MRVFLIALSVFTFSFASVNELDGKLKRLYSLHALECAPEEIGKAESYVETLKGLEIKENGKIKKVNINDTDRLIYENKAKVYIAKAEKKVFSDVDNDGIPCYKEIENGTNPFVSDKKYIKISKTDKKPQPKKIKQQIKPKKAEKKPKFEPLKTHAMIHFELNSAKIKKEYLPYLNVISRYLKTHKNLKVKIVGYTDNIGTKSYNNKLALKRAKAVKNYLIKMGVKSDRIEIIGKGKEDYLFDNKSKLNRFTNRRAEFFVMETK